MKFQGFIGQAYELKSVNVDGQKLINLFPEVIESGFGKEAQVAYFKSTPGLEFLLTVGDGPLRLVHFDNTPVSDDNPGTRVFVVSGNTVYKVLYNSGTEVWEATSVGTIGTSTGPVRAASTNLNLGLTVFVDGYDSYLYSRFDSGGGIIEEDFDNFAAFGYPVVPNATHVIYLDGYFIYSADGTNQFFVSDIGSLNIDPLSFASAEGDPDNIVGIISNNRDLYLFGERSIEMWGNTGNADFPFERVQGGFIEKGCVAGGSIAKIDGMVFWLGRDAFGQGQVYASQGINPQRISTHAIEYAISTYADISTATGYTYQSDGHSFYVLNFDEATWVYDMSTKMWHERAYLNDGTLERHRVQFCQFLPEFGIHMVGDYANNKVYQFNSNHFYDDEDTIVRLRRCPHLSAQKKRVFYHQLELDMMTGVGLDGSGPGVNPQVMMRYSNDGGHTWSDESWRSMDVGGIGRFSTRVRWQRLGSSYDRVFEIKITDPVDVVLLGAEIDFEVGAS